MITLKILLTAFQNSLIFFEVIKMYSSKSFTQNVLQTQEKLKILLFNIFKVLFSKKTTQFITEFPGDLFSFAYGICLFQAYSRMVSFLFVPGSLS